ncbi:MAG: GNAT family N-acetyltransferase [Actinomycetota bacterium]
MEVTIRELPPERWPEAGAMAGRAFWTEEYMRPLGTDPIALYATVQDVYLGMDITTHGTVALGAFAADHVVGVACITTADACFFCTMDPEAGPTHDDPISHVFHQVDLAIRELHTGLPTHAYIGPIAVEPTLQHQGIGHRLVEESFARATVDHPDTVALDCDPRLQTFYEAHGFRPIARVTDAWGFDIVGLRRDPEPA